VLEVELVAKGQGMQTRVIWGVQSQTGRQGFRSGLMNPNGGVCMVMIVERGASFAGCWVGCWQYQCDIVVKSNNQLVHCVKDLLKLFLCKQVKTMQRWSR